MWVTFCNLLLLCDVTEQGQNGNGDCQGVSRRNASSPQTGQVASDGAVSLAPLVMNLRDSLLRKSFRVRIAALAGWKMNTSPGFPEQFLAEVAVICHLIWWQNQNFMLRIKQHKVAEHIATLVWPQNPFSAATGRGFSPLFDLSSLFVFACPSLDKCSYHMPCFILQQEEKWSRFLFFSNNAS